MSSPVDLDIAPVRAEPAYRMVAQLIERKILKGEWQVGDSLPTELFLSKRLGVNRSTLREAIRVLEQNGLLRRNAGKKLFVSAPLQSDISPVCLLRLSSEKSASWSSGKACAVWNLR
jgi:GntR family transcriptional repressor for pyruvate dehydrogenase complex